MNTIQKGVVTLLRSAITQENLVLPEGFDLEAALPDVRRHHMATLAYDGALRCGVPRQDPAMKSLFQDYVRAMMVSENQMGEIGRVCKAFDENGIDYMPLKGCNMKALYPKPELRIMGDADILIRVSQREKIDSVMTELGFSFFKESDHELVWRSQGLYLELHKHLIPSYNLDYYAYYGDGWRLAKAQKGNRFSMTPEDDFIFQFTHFAKHYRDGGIGCRYVVDLWVYLNHTDLNEAYIESELKKLRLLEFYKNVRHLVRVWFEDEQSNEKMDYMTDFIFASGSWGAIESRVLSRAVRDSTHSVLGFSGKLLYLWQTAFPSVEILRDKYTVLKKAPWMLPLVWIYRPFYKFFKERKTLKRQEKNLEALSKENMELRRQLMEYVGIGYNF